MAGCRKIVNVSGLKKMGRRGFGHVFSLFNCTMRQGLGKALPNKYLTVEK